MRSAKALLWVMRSVKALLSRWESRLEPLSVWGLVKSSELGLPEQSGLGPELSPWALGWVRTWKWVRRAASLSKCLEGLATGRSEPAGECWRVVVGGLVPARGRPARVLPLSGPV